MSNIPADLTDELIVTQYVTLLVVAKMLIADADIFEALGYKNKEVIEDNRMIAKSIVQQTTRTPWGQEAIRRENAACGRPPEEIARVADIARVLLKVTEH